MPGPTSIGNGDAERRWRLDGLDVVEGEEREDANEIGHWKGGLVLIGDGVTVSHC